MFNARHRWVLGGLLTVCPATLSSATAPPAAEFMDALHARGPLVAGPGADLYDGLIGDWEAEVVDHLPGGVEQHGSAEMHFAWVLEGRAIQDLWIAPARRDRGAPARRGGAAPGNRYGTTLRVYDPTLGAWRITWWNPVTGIENRLVARRVGSQIVHTGADAEGRLIRWVFVAVGPESFQWRGEHSEDAGMTWVCDTEYFARRRAPLGPPAAASRAE